MSEEHPTEPTEDVQALKARIAELEAENEKLKTAITEAMNTLKAYVEKEKEAAIKAFSEAKKMGCNELEGNVEKRNIHATTIYKIEI